MNQRSVAWIVVLVVSALVLPILLALLGWFGLLLYLDSLSR